MTLCESHTAAAAAPGLLKGARNINDLVTFHLKTAYDVNEPSFNAVNAHTALIGWAHAEHWACPRDQIPETTISIAKSTRRVWNITAFVRIDGDGVNESKMEHLLIRILA
jgi:hypothetical protein